MGGGGQDNGGSRRKVFKEDKGWGSRIARMSFVMFLIRFNQKVRGFTVPMKGVQKGLMRGTFTTEKSRVGNSLQ